MTVLCFDIGGTKTLAALVEGADVIEERRVATDLSGGEGPFLEALAALALPWSGRFALVGAAVTGIVRRGVWRALNPATLAIPAGFALSPALSSRFGLPAVAVNDAQAAAWGEWAHGAGARQDMVFLTVSTGVGGGVVTDGRLLGGLAGSFGQFVDDAGARLEDGVAGRWMAAEAARAGHLGGAETVFAHAGVPWAEAILSRSAARVAALCRNIQLALDPVRIVIGGGIGLAEGYLARVSAALGGVDPDLAPRIVPAQLGARAGVIGVAALAAAAVRTHHHRETGR